MGSPIDANGTQADIDWSQVDWQKVEKAVLRLQHRIFMAKVKGDAKGMESLQRLLASSRAAKLLAKRVALYEALLDERFVESWTRPSRRMGDDMDRYYAIQSVNAHAGREVLTGVHKQNLRDEQPAGKTLLTEVLRIVR